MTYYEKLQLVCNHIKTGYEFMGSRWENCEAEVIALQTLSACGLNQEKHGVAISWQGSGTLRVSGNGLANNPEGVSRLLNDRMITLGPYDNHLGLAAPEGTVRSEDGCPMVFRCTEKLLDYAIEFMQLNSQNSVVAHE